MKKNNLQKSTRQMLDKNRQECIENRKRKETGNQKMTKVFFIKRWLANRSFLGFEEMNPRKAKIGADRGRTGDLMNAIHALYQLSYSPFISICF